MSKPSRAQWVIIVSVVIAFVLSIVILRSTSTVRASPSTMTVPCSSPTLASDVAIDACLESKIHDVTRAMNSALRKESVYFHYSTRAHDWSVAKKAQSTYLAYVRETCLAQAHPYQSGTIVPILYGECELSSFHQRLQDIQGALVWFQKGGEAQSTS